MIRIGLSAILWLMLAAAASAQGVVYNPDSPRGRRDLVVNPPAPAAPPSQAWQPVPPARWPQVTNQVGQTTWGTIGTYGWVGVTTPTWQQPQPQ